MTYLTYRNEHIWPSPMCLHMIESFSFGFHVSYFWLNTTHIFEKRCYELFMYLWQISIWLWHHTFQYIFAPPFPSLTSFWCKAFSTLFSFLEIDIWRALLKKKKKCEKIFKHKSTHVCKTIDQSFMTSLKIYLQQSKVDF